MSETEYKQTIFSKAFDAMIAFERRELERWNEQEKQHATAHAMDEAALGEDDGH